MTESCVSHFDEMPCHGEFAKNARCDFRKLRSEYDGVHIQNCHGARGNGGACSEGVAFSTRPMTKLCVLEGFPDHRPIIVSRQARYHIYVGRFQVMIRKGTSMG
jgi:hypothetical protein